MPEARRALVVDDNMANRMLAKAMLARLGWTVDQADCGETALRMSSEFNYPLILLDISMPGLSGEDTCVALRQGGAVARIIAYTAHAFADEQARILAVGFDDILIKPINIERLQQLVSNV